MVYSCAAIKCTNRHGKLKENGKKLQFHKFPLKNPDLLKKWVTALKRESWQPSKFARLCGEHFLEDDYKTSDQRYLKDETVPSVFNSVSTDKRKRKEGTKRPLKIRKKKLKLVTTAVIPPLDNNQGTVMKKIDMHETPEDFSDFVRENLSFSSQEQISLFKDDVDIKVFKSKAKTPRTISKRRSMRNRMKALKKARLEKSRAVPELTGRRIVDISFFIKQIQEISNHGTFSCSFKDMVFISELRQGFKSGVKFRCQLCSFTKTIWTDMDENSEEKMPVNSAAVTGIGGIGGRFSNLKKFSTILNIPCMSFTTFKKEYNIIKNESKAASQEMKFDKSAKKDKQLVLENGDGDVACGLEYTVVTDETLANESVEEGLRASSKASLKKDSENGLGAEPSVFKLGSDSQIAPVRLLDTVDADSPYLSVPGSSTQENSSFCEVEQDVHLTMTCEIYPESPEDTNILSACAKSSEGNDNGSLLQPPVLIKEEPVSSEEDL